MKSYNICFDMDDLCRKDWMKHPLTYYRIKGKSSDAKERSKKGVSKKEKPKGAK